MMNRSNNPSHREWMLYHGATSHSILKHCRMLRPLADHHGDSHPVVMVVGRGSKRDLDLNAPSTLFCADICFFIADMILSLICMKD